MTLFSKTDDKSPLSTNPLSLLMRLALATNSPVTIDCFLAEDGKRWWQVKAGDLEFVTYSHLPAGHPMEREMEWSNILANLVALDQEARKRLEPKP